MKAALVLTWIGLAPFFALLMGSWLGGKKPGERRRRQNEEKK
jgi:hypothetical protein